jgi:predicted RNA-binding Zn ribbon-like protein
MNTIWADTGGEHDDLASAGALADWIAVVYQRGREELGTPTPGELREARQLRDALRRIAAFSTDDCREGAQSPIEFVGDAVAAVNDAIKHQPGIRLALRDGQLHLDSPPTASPTRTTLAELSATAIDLLTGPDATRLRACYAPGCVLYFVKTHPRREWCSEACGNRVRAARHYRRTRTRMHD